MATLEMVSLRSTMPNTGLVTLRYPTIRLNAPMTISTPQVHIEGVDAGVDTVDAGNQDEEGREAR
jgi:hypothetical protein